MAEFYVKGKYYGAAKTYYAKIIKQYPDTRLAQESRNQIDKFKTEPNSPTPPFKWLADILPQSTREGPVLPKNIPSVAAAPPTDTTTR